MSVDQFTAKRQIDALPTVETLRRIVSADGVLGADQPFIINSLRAIAFRNSGDISEAVQILKEHYKGRTDLDIDVLAEKAREDALFVLRSHDLSALNMKAWDAQTIPHASVNFESLGKSLERRGFHLLNACLGWGKTEKVLIPELMSYRGTPTRVLLLTPNENTAIELAKKAGVAHYKTYGETREAKRLAWEKHPQMVMCFHSYVGLSEDPNFVPPHIILWDEITECLEFVRRELPDAKPEESRYATESVMALFKFASFYKKIIAASADCPTAFVHKVANDLAQIMNTHAHYYKTDGSHLEGKIYTRFETKEDLILNTLRRAQSGQSGWIFTDQSDDQDEKPNFTRFVNIFKKHAPELKIEAIDRRVMKSAKGREIKEMGLANYAKYCRKELGIDLFIVSPIAKSQISVVFDEDELDFCFDFTAVFSDYLDICSPWSLRNASNRARQTQIIDYWINEKNGGPKEVEKDAGKKIFPKDIDFSRAYAAEKLYWETVYSYAQFKLANRANRNWLFEELLKEKGAIVRKADITISESERGRYAEILLAVKQEAEQLAVERFENNMTRRVELLHSCYEFDEPNQEWKTLRLETELSPLIREAASIDGRAAERLYQLLTLDGDQLAELDRGSAIAFYQDTAISIDPLLNEIMEQIIRQKRLPMPEWFLHGDGEFWLAMENLPLDDLEPNLRNNFQAIKATIAPKTTYGATTLGVLKLIGNELGLSVDNKPKAKTRNQWRTRLFNQLKKEKPGWFHGKQDWPRKYELMSKILLEKLRDASYKPNEFERGLLEDRPEFVRIEKKRFVSRGVVEIYRHWLSIVREEKRVEEIENEILSDTA